MLHTKSKFSLNYLLFLILSSGVILILTLPKVVQADSNKAMFQITKKDTLSPQSKIDTTRFIKVDTMDLKISKDSINHQLNTKQKIPWKWKSTPRKSIFLERQK